MASKPDLKLRLARYWLPLGLWCAIIFVQSSFAAPDMAPRWPNADKFVHAGVYALLAVLCGRAFNTIPAWRGRPLGLIATGTLLAALYGAADEWHQSFVAARIADGMDLLADCIGGFLGACLYAWVVDLRRRGT